MRELETDYLVVGAGATGMAFVDALIVAAEVDVVMVDRRHRPGGHWVDAYPFVRLHQPSPCYGVTSRPLGNNRIEASGPNAGFYELATGPEISEYYGRVLHEELLPSGQVRFLPQHEYGGDGSDGHVVTSLLTGETTRVKVRKKLVDATYVESAIPAKHTPEFEIDDGVTLVPPNGLVDLAEAPSGFTVIGAGKTAMDTCNWLLEQGVDPDRIRWVRPREGWFFDRAFMQPLELVGSYYEMQARWLTASAQARDGNDFARRLEDADVFLRIDPAVAPTVYRGPTISRLEVESLRRIGDIVRRGRVRRLGTQAVQLEDGTMPSDPRQVYVDCTAAGVRPTVLRPVFEEDSITMQYVTPGFACWSAATIGTVEALRDDVAEQNRLCPPFAFSGRPEDLPEFALTSMTGLMRRGAEPDLAAWNEGCRLNISRGIKNHLGDQRVLDSLGVIGAQIEPARKNLERLVG